MTIATIAALISAATGAAYGIGKLAFWLKSRRQKARVEKAQADAAVRKAQEK